VRRGFQDYRGERRGTGGEGEREGELRVIITIIFHSLLRDADSGSEINLSGFKFSLKKSKIFYSREIYKS